MHMGVDGDPALHVHVQHVQHVQHVHVQCNIQPLQTAHRHCIQ
jgi:hypothetical protein